MKQIINVKIKTRKTEFAECRTDMLVVGRFSEGEPDEVIQTLDEKLGGRLGQLAELGDFTGKPKTHAIVYGEGKIAAQRLLLLGLGEQKKATLETLTGRRRPRRAGPSK